VIAVGLVSGTSADGVSAAGIRLGEGRPRLIAYRAFPYPPGLRRRALAAGSADARELSALNRDLGVFFGRAARRFIGRVRPAVIGSHGQTVWHEPGRHTLQLGEPAEIAAATGTAVVSDFRPGDIAAGGQGAPLTPAFDAAILGVRPAAVLNLGGIANVTILSATPRGFDTGPGNCLLDAACRAAYGRPFDAGGRLAAKGRVDADLLRRLRHPWLRRAPPKSTGPELWSPAFLEERAGRLLRSRPADVLATLCRFTAATAAEALERHGGRRIQEVIVAGGGTRNASLMRELEAAVWPAALRPSSVYGIHPLAREAAAFAWLAARTLRGFPGNPRSVTGGRPAVLGRITPAGRRR
jgi:anhydro-N-acetylmuramic acid kinase